MHDDDDNDAHLLDPADPPGAVAGEEGVLHPDQPDVEAGGVERGEQVPGHHVPRPRHEQRVDRLEGEGRGGLASSCQGLHGAVGVILNTASDHLQRRHFVEIFQIPVNEP